MHDKSADGLRGLAALNVVVSHFFLAFFPALLAKAYPGMVPAPPADASILFHVFQTPFFSLLYNGNFPVLVFFALSGYVLTLPYYRQNFAALRQRLFGRYLRLNIPAFVSMFIALVLLQAGAYVHMQAAQLSGSTMWLTNFYAQNVDPIRFLHLSAYETIFMGSTTLNPPIWTLKIEFLGSLYLLLFYLLKPKRFDILAYALVFSVLYYFHRADTIYYATLFAGASLPRWRIPVRFTLPLAAIALYFGAFLYDSSAYDFLPYALAGTAKNIYNAIGAVLLVHAMIQGFGRGILSAAPIQFLGRISFPLYLTHFCILCSLTCFLYLHLPHSFIGMLGLFVLHMAVCIGFATLFERVIDAPAIALARRFGQAADSLLYKYR